MMGYHKLTVLFLLGTLAAHAEKFDENFVGSDYFIDRTNFLETFFKDYKHPEHPIFISAPSGFGKSTIVSMMEAFFDIQTSKNGTALPPEETSNHKLFTQPYKKKNGETYNLAISKTPFFKDHFGKYPVVLLDFKQLRVTNYATFLDSIKALMLNATSKYSYILDVSKNISSYGSFKKISSPDFKSDDKTYELILRHSGKILTQAVSEHFGQGCVVLIDEFDLPPTQVLFESLNEAEITKIIQFFITFLSGTLKNNKSLRAAFLTGRVKFGGAKTRSIDNVQHEDFSARVNLATSFGLTEANLKDLLNRCESKKFALKHLVQYYDGYRVQKSNVRVYPTHSVIQSFVTGNLGVHWQPEVNEKALYKAFRLDQIGHEILLAMSGKPLKAQLSESAGLTELLQLKTYLDSIQLPKDAADKMAAKFVPKFCQYFLELGYFTTKPLGDTTELSVPNREVRIKLNEMVQLALKEEFKYDIGLTDKLTESMLDLNGTDSYQKFIDAVQKLFKNSLDGLSNRDIRAVTYSAFIKRFNEATVKDVRDPSTGKTTGSIVYVPIPVNKTGIVIGYGIKKSSRKVIEQIVKGNHMKQILTFKTEILIGLNLDSKKKLFSASFLLNSHKLKDAEEVIADVD